MKNLLLIFIFFLATFVKITAQKSSLDQLFDRYQNAEGVTSIKIAKPMFGMLDNLSIHDSELAQLKPLLNKIQGVKILLIEKPNPEDSGDDDDALFNSIQREILKSVDNLKYEELVTMNSSDGKIKFLTSDTRNGILKDLLLNISSGESNILMMLDGKITLEDVNRMVNEAQNSTYKTTVATEDISASGVVQVRNVGKFTGIKVSSGIKVSFTQDSKQSVIIETNPDLQNYVKTELEGDILKIYVENTDGKNLNFKKLNAIISAPELSKIAVNSGATFTGTNTINSPYFQIATTSGGHINADLATKEKVELSTTSGSSARLHITAKNLEMSATSGSDAVLVGNIEETKFSVSSAASVNAQDLVSKISTISANSASNLKVNVSEKIQAAITSGANVRYRANSTVVKNAGLSSGGTIKSF